MKELTPQEKELAAKALDFVICYECGERVATCVGAYEGSEVELPACDECCGHGNEDGHCEPVITHYQRQLAKVGLAIQPINEKETK